MREFISGNCYALADSFSLREKNAPIYRFAFASFARIKS